MKNNLKSNLRFLKKVKNGEYAEIETDSLKYARLKTCREDIPEEFIIEWSGGDSIKDRKTGRLK